MKRKKRQVDSKIYVKMQKIYSSQNNQNQKKTNNVGGLDYLVSKLISYGPQDSV